MHEKSNFLNNDNIMSQYFNRVYTLTYANSSNLRKTFLTNLMDSEIGVYVFKYILNPIICLGQRTVDDIIDIILTLPCKTYLKPLTIKVLLFEKYIQSLIKPNLGNRCLHEFHKMAGNESLSIDLSTSKLWYAIALLKEKDYQSALRVVNQVLSGIPPFAFCVSRNDTRYENSEAKQLYADMLMNSSSTTMDRAKKAWMMPFTFVKSMGEFVPLAIQIEL